ncbi:MAG: energy-coupled thiamine transporter ThiT [Lachnospirales bacterium]
MKTKTLVTSSLLVALGVILSLVTPFSLFMGGSLTLFSMLPIVMVGYLYGLKPGIIAGVVYGLIGCMIKPNIYYPMQFVVDYILAFGALGLSGLFYKSKSKYALLYGYLLGVFGRYVFACLSGYLFFAEYAGDANVVWYTVSYNATYIVPEAVLTILILPVVTYTIKSMNLKEN